MAIDLTDRLDQAMKNNQPKARQVYGAIPPSLGSGLVGVLPAPIPDPVIEAPAQEPSPAPLPGRNASGVITAPLAQAAAAGDMNRSGGVFGSVDMKRGNDVLAKENANRQSIIDSQAGKSGAIGSTQTADSNALLDKWDQQYRNQQAVQTISGMSPRVAEAAGRLLGAQEQADAVRHGQDLNYGATIAGQGITARGQDLHSLGEAQRNNVAMRGQDVQAATDAMRIGLDGQRLNLAQRVDQRAEDRWNVERPTLVAQAKDSDAVRSARQGLLDAIAKGDQAEIEKARTTAVAAGIKFDKPNNEFVAVTDQNGINVTRTNKDTGAIDIIDPKTGSIKSFPAPGQKPAPQSAPPEALSFLKKNPAQAAQFKAKYGYLPEGY